MRLPHLTPLTTPKPLFIVVALLLSSATTPLFALPGESADASNAGSPELTSATINVQSPAARQPASASPTPTPTMTPSEPGAVTDASPVSPTPRPTEVAVPELDIEPVEQRAPSTPFAPTSVYLPSIDVEAPIVPVGRTPEGAMEAPEQYGEVGWFEHGAIPGTTGRAILAGHVDSKSGPAIFYKLDELQPGDAVTVRFAGNGMEQTFTVRESRVLPADGSPAADVFGPSDRPELILITCSGTFDRAAGQYLDRLVVYAEKETT